MDTNLYNEWRFVSLSPFPLWLLGLLVAAAVAGIVFATVSLKRESRPGRRRALVVLRLLGGLALLLLLLEPGKRLMQTTRVKNRVVVLVDRSASMGFPVGVGQPRRADAVKAMLADAQPKLAELSNRFTIETYAFDRDVQPLDSSKLEDQLEPRGGTTDILSAIRQAASGGGAAAGRKLSGVVVISDGADNAELAEGLTPRAKSQLKELGAPVSVIAAGSGALKDVAIEKIAVDDFAFVRNTVDVEATVRLRGYGALDIPVTLKREGRIVATRTVHAQGDGSYPITFSFAPDQTGQFVFTVETPVLEDESVASNNQRSFALKVIRDRVRVLLVVGRPSWDERFLRALLKQDPNIDLISFFILRGAADNPQASESELSLIPFPVNEIFREQLRTFDLVIFQNFAHSSQAYRMDGYLPGIRDYIKEGGAFVMIGGENSFGEAKYERTELGEALPVEPIGLPPNEDKFRARLTTEGRQHPITAVGSGSDATTKIWETMPELAGVHMTRAKDGAQVLLEHPFLTEGGKNIPVVAAWDFGRGRVMAVTVDSTWRWNFMASAQGASARAYDRLYNNAIRWLVRDPDLTPVKVAAEKPGVEPGENIAVIVSARQQDYAPAAGAEIEVELIDANSGQVITRQRATAGADGTARVELTPPRPGPYKIVGHARKAGVELGQGEDAVAVRAAGPELADAAPRPELLKAIAHATGGTYSELSGSFPDVALIDPETVEVGRRKDLPIWDKWYFLAVLAAAVGAEWALRRRWGYV